MYCASGCHPASDDPVAGRGSSTSNSPWVETDAYQAHVPELTVNGSAVEWHHVDWLHDDGRMQQEEKPHDLSLLSRLKVPGDSLTFRISSRIHPADLFVDVSEGAVTESTDFENPGTMHRPIEEGKLQLDDASASFTIPIAPGKPLFLNVYCSYYTPPATNHERWTNEVNWPLLVNQPEP